MSALASNDTGCITDVPADNDNIPAELLALGVAIGKVPASRLDSAWLDSKGNFHFGKSQRQQDNNLPPVVAFTGLAGSGKSTATRYLVEKHGYTLVKFAGPLKDMLRAIGLSEEQIEGDLKEKPSYLLCGKTPRYAMQSLGTEWARCWIGDDFWIRLWLSRVEKAASEGKRVVVDDCRFPNEAAAIRKLGGDIYRLVGRGGIPGEHESERGCGDADLIIANDNTPELLERRVEEALKRYG